MFSSHGSAYWRLYRVYRPYIHNHWSGFQSESWRFSHDSSDEPIDAEAIQRALCFYKKNKAWISSLRIAFRKYSEASSTQMRLSTPESAVFSHIPSLSLCSTTITSWSSRIRQTDVCYRGIWDVCMHVSMPGAIIIIFHFVHIAPLRAYLFLYKKFGICSSSCIWKLAGIFFWFLGSVSSIVSGPQCKLVVRLYFFFFHEF